MTNYKKAELIKLAEIIKRNTGFRVFLSEKPGCAHGFITDNDGTRVVSFQYDISGIRFHGNYKSKGCGTGWVMDSVDVNTVTNAESLSNLFKCHAPHWATKGEQVKMTTLAQHLATYGASSMFVEV